GHRDLHVLAQRRLGDPRHLRLVVHARMLRPPRTLRPSCDLTHEVQGSGPCSPSATGAWTAKGSVTSCARPRSPSSSTYGGSPAREQTLPLRAGRSKTSRPISASPTGTTNASGADGASQPSRTPT